MSTLPLLQSLKESILSQASVKAIYGEPISAHGKTVVPVAKIMYGYGAGAGTGGVGDSSARGEGGGGGGGVRAIPVGVIEISDQQTRFVPITDRKKLTGAVLAGHRSRYVARLAEKALKSHLCRFCHCVFRGLSGHRFFQDSPFGFLPPLVPMLE